jgi:hypothetical protein
MSVWKLSAHYEVAELAWIAGIGELPAIQVILGHHSSVGPLNLSALPEACAPKMINRREIATPVGTQSY